MRGFVADDAEINLVRGVFARDLGRAMAAQIGSLSTLLSLLSLWP
jgi:hypothetical protein